jgi:hypothetical protein
LAFLGAKTMSGPIGNQLIACPLYRHLAHNRRNRQVADQ